MSSTALPAPAVTTPIPTSVPLRELAPWLVFAGVMMLIIVYFISAQQNDWVHEWVHDGRHLLGFPCH
jgi:cobalt transporter subunit CbtB